MKKPEILLRSNLFEVAPNQKPWIIPRDTALQPLQDSLNRRIALGRDPAIVFSGARSLTRYHLHQAERALAQQDYSQAFTNLVEVCALIRHESREFRREMQHPVFDALLCTGHQAWRAQKFKDALKAYDLAFWFAREAEPLIPLQIAQVCLNRGLVYQKLEQILQALEDFNLAIAVLAPVAHAEPQHISLLAQAFRNRGELQQSLQRTEQALADFLQAIATQKDLLNPPDPLELAVSFRKLGLLYLHQQQYPEALEHFSRSIEVYRLLLDQGRQELIQDLVSTFMHRSQVLREQNQLLAARQDCDQALHLLRQDALPIRERLLFQARLFTARGLISWQIQAKAEAYSDYLAALSFYRDLVASGLHFDTEMAHLHINLAHLSLEQAHYDRALDHYDQALDILSQQPNPIKQAQIFLERGNVYREMGHLEQASNDYASALTLYEGLKPQQRLSVVAAIAEVLLQQGLLAADQGEAQLAYQKYSAAIELLQPVRPKQLVQAEHIWVRSHYFRGFLQATLLNQPHAALADFEQIEQVCPGLTSYDQACLLARLGNIPEAFEALERHLRSPEPLGLADIAADPDLCLLQNLPRWQELMHHFHSPAS